MNDWTIDLDEFISNAIKEDVGDGDHTSLACVPAEGSKTAFLLVKEQGILAGVEVALQVFNHIDPELNTKVYLNDGNAIKPGDIVFEVSGSARSILKAERLVLNCMQRMSGIATNTRKYVNLVKEYPCKILDTRKTTPGFRVIEKWAVRIGGGVNHRFGLYDMIMIKDNHIDFAGGIEKAITKTRNYLEEVKKDLKIEVEARNLKEVQEIMAVGGIDRIMLDNFSIEEMKTAVQM
ncbi:MAG TPA: carboxylating nicotinate-nucleotide diphosphorylase, partial [Flavobacteriales bacterium]|nr:carboxylating nicotinate-nucleotide diphosphorylase [Flavobacteriales bacterium]